MGEEMLVRICMYTCDTDNVSQDIKHEPPTDIKREKIDKAIEEMEIASYSKGYDEVFEILDKLIESEEK